MKRVFDIICSFLLLIVLSPVFLLIACAVRFTSSGPAIFRSPRTGYKGAEFIMFKFRTMKNGSGDPKEIIMRGDYRVTQIGKFLRSTHSDELPQLWNVLRGEMSLVGPRPYTPEISATCTLRNKKFHERLKIYPGITGLEQINGRGRAIERGPSFTLALDLIYIKRQNFWFDLLIILKTILVVLKRQGM